MNLLPLNATDDFNLWPSFSPGEWLDFNPTVVKLPDGRSLAIIRRDRVPPVPGEGTIWSVIVDDDLRPIDTPNLLLERGEDPRAVVIDERLLLFYVVIEKESTGKVLGSCMMLAEFTTTTFPPAITRCSQLPKNPTGNPELQNVMWEKNWVPFIIAEGQIALIYSHAPWTVLILDPGTPTSAPSFVTAYRDMELGWPYGEIRGGTPPIRYNNESLITFFHSAQVVGSRNVYMVGACIFADTAPFTPQLITLEPLLIAPYRSLAMRFGWNVLASVLFPLGAVRGEGDFKLLCGIDDGEIGSFAISESILNSRLTPVNPKLKQSIVTSDANTLALAEGPIVFTPDPALTAAHVPLARFLRMLPLRGGTYLDIGAEEGLYIAYLANHFSRVVAIESSHSPWLERNLATNAIENCRIYENNEAIGKPHRWKKDNVRLMRISTNDPSRVLFDWGGLFKHCTPIVLIHFRGSSEDEKRCEEIMTHYGYAMERLFPLLPHVIICTTAAHRKTCRWLL